MDTLPPILVVDDNHDNAEIIRQYLEVRGYPITVAYSGDEALAESLIGEEALEAGGDGGFVERVDQQSGVAGDFTQDGNVAGEHRHATGHGLERRHAEAFMDGRPDEGGGATENGRAVVVVDVAGGPDDGGAGLASGLHGLVDVGGKPAAAAHEH